MKIWVVGRSITMAKQRVKHTLLSLAALILTASLLTACGEKPKETAPTVSMYDLGKAMTSADETLPEMTNVNSNAENAQELFAYVSDMDYEKTDGFFLSYSAEGKADEIAVIAVKDATNVTEAETSLKDHLDSRVKLYTQYDPSQVQRANSALVFTSGRYAVLIICDNSDKVKEAFEDFLKAQQTTDKQ